jgi:phage repressor protein C with HTH and peptisase S24 domain
MKSTSETNEDPPPKEKKYHTPIIARILKFIKHIDLSVSAFEDSVGLSNGYLRKVKSPGYEMISTILSRYPQLSERWLGTGEGEMLKNGSLEETVDEVQEIGESYANRFKKVPVFEVDVFAGNTSLVNTVVDEAIIGWARMPGYEDCIGWVRARGDSMTPLIKPNDLIAVLPPVNKKYILWGSMYIVTFEGDMAPHPMIKYVHEGKDNIVILRSLNKKYTDMKVAMDDIKAFYPTRAGVIEF